MKRIRITEYLDIDLDKELWCCNRCGQELGPARESYKRFTLVCERDPKEVHRSYIDKKFSPRGYDVAPDPAWCRIIEFYCSNCAALFEVEYLPLGHPITHDLEIDIDALKARYVSVEDKSRLATKFSLSSSSALKAKYVSVDDKV